MMLQNSVKYLKYSTIKIFSINLFVCYKDGEKVNVTSDIDN